jgi:hypothetical protein
MSLRTRSIAISSPAAAAPGIASVLPAGASATGYDTCDPQPAVSLTSVEAGQTLKARVGASDQVGGYIDPPIGRSPVTFTAGSRSRAVRM